MNSKFYNLDADRRISIINGGYRIFALNRYKKAPMSEIADAGGISKSLLFHYFRNKQELYIFLWDNAQQLTAEAKERHRVYETASLFEMLRRGLAAKCEMLRKYPYMSLFSINAYYEDEPEIRRGISAKVSEASESTFDIVKANADTGRLRDDVSFESIYGQILFASEGLLNSWYRNKTIDVDVFEKEYLSMIDHWERIYGR